MNCPVNIDAKEWDQIKLEEAVVIREFEKGPKDQRERFGEIVAQGNETDMREFADTYGLVVVFTEVTFIGQQCVLVKDLLGPTKGA